MGHETGNRKGDHVAGKSVAVELPPDVFEAAKRAAAIDQVDVPTLLADLVKRRSEYVESLTEAAAPSFSLEDYDLIRDPRESDEEYEDRRSLFR